MYTDPDVFDGIISRPAATEIDAHLFAVINGSGQIAAATPGGAIQGVTVNKTVALAPVYAGGTTLGDALGDCSIFTPAYGAVPVQVGSGGVTASHRVMVGTGSKVVEFVPGNGNVAVGVSEETATSGEARIRMYSEAQQGATSFPAGLLTTNGAIPVRPSASYIITKAGVLADTLAAPTATTDDGVTITVTSSTAFAHTITATGLLNTGSASVNVVTFAAFAGAGLTLQAYQGKWNVLASTGITFS